MSFHRPQRVTPIRSARRDRARGYRRSQSGVMGVMAAAALVGAGAGAVVANDGDLAAVREWAADAGIVRKSIPQPGAYYRNCDAARAAGVAPIYRGEPGYRTPLDADGDNIACEPYPR